MSDIRLCNFGLACFLALLSSAGTFAFENGAKHVVALRDVDLRYGSKVVGSADAGEVLTVEKTQGKWLLVKSQSGKKGWVDKKDVGNLSKVTGTLLRESDGQPYKQQSILLYAVYFYREKESSAYREPPGDPIFLRGDKFGCPVVKTDNAGRFEFDGLAPMIYTIGFGKNYDEALKNEAHVTVGGRIFVFQVKPGKDLLMDAVRASVAAPPVEGD